MAKGPIFKVEGMEQLEASINRLNNVDPALQLLAKQCGQLLYTTVAYKTPVRTGALRASLSVETEETPEGIDITVGTAQVYAAAVEFGYNGRMPHSYLRAGLAEARPAIEAAVEQGILSGVIE